LVTFFNRASGGYVDAFDPEGNLKLRFAQGQFSQPWGIALAPNNFAAFSNMVLVANTTGGMIAAFNMKGVFEGNLEDATGSPIAIPGLWAIAFGDGNAESGPTSTLYYSAGGSFYTTGIFGAITAN
jgi:uncharacterized protein (TIGR03118 family)